jgi:hypothetical protein
MMMFPADVALATSRGRRRASTSARKRALTEGKMLSSSSSSSLLGGSSRSFSGRRSTLGVPGPDGDKAEGSGDLPPAIALLEQVTMAFSVTKHQSDVRYVLTAHHGALRVAWRHARSFDEYRKLQQRLLKVLNHGHFCDADCPWLSTFLKSYFPKKHLFHFGAGAKVADARKETLARFFSTLQGCLLNRANHVCSVMTGPFAAELVAFIYGDALQQHGVGDIYQLLRPVTSNNNGGDVSPLSARGSLSFSTRKSGSMSMHLDAASMASFAEDEPASTDADDCCSLCESSLGGEAFASSQSLSLTASSSDDDPLEFSASLPSSSSLGAFARGNSNSNSNSARGNSSRSLRRYYITTLGCGHQFHDECIVPRLNESMNCPTCGRAEASS